MSHCIQDSYIYHSNYMYLLTNPSHQMIITSVYIYNSKELSINYVTLIGPFLPLIPPCSTSSEILKNAKLVVSENVM